VELHLVMPAAGIGSVMAAISALACLNVLYLQTHPTPSLYRSGVVYSEPRLARHGGQDMISIPEVLRAGAGSCGDLTAWRIAELYTHGELGTPVVTRVGDLWHAKLRRADGSLECPSLILGMR